jgi:DNA-binding transcriptional MerR regulator
MGADGTPGGTGYLKARDLAEQAGLPEKEVKRLLRSYAEFFAPGKQGRSRVYPPETVGILRQIAELEEVGTTPPTIRGVLTRNQGDGAGQEAAHGPATTGFPAAAGEALTLGALSDIRSLQAGLGELGEEIALLRQKLGEHEQKIIAHQQQIRLLRHEVDEQKNDALARKAEGSGAPVWKRLFR